VNPSFHVKAVDRGSSPIVKEGVIAKPPSCSSLILCQEERNAT